MFSIENRLRTVAFVAGFSMMAFELVAARLLAPTIGNSTYTWTCVIGVIMAALSLGYFLGGMLADKRGQLVDIAFLSQITAVLVLITCFTNILFTTFLAEAVVDQRVQGLLASLVLFAPVSVVIGMISPYLVKLASTSLKTLGRTAAGLSTWNAIGSITGTFITGFVLFAVIGSSQALATIALVLLLASWLIEPKNNRQVRLAISAVVLVTIISVIVFHDTETTINIDTASANYRVGFQYVNGSDEKVVYLTSSPRGAQSAVYSGGINKLLFWYTNEFAKVAENLTSKERILVLGGGTFTVPRYLAEKYPDSTVDVVEIDPELKRIAEDYFFFEQPANLNMFFEDARVFVNKSTQKYDLILVDVYNGVIIPWQFTTIEYTQKLAGLLQPDGVVAVNAIASEEGNCRPLLDALNAPYAASLRYHQYTTDKDNETGRKNMILIYSNQNIVIDGYQKLDIPAQRPFNDNFAPIEPLQLNCGL